LIRQAGCAKEVSSQFVKAPPALFIDDFLEISLNICFGSWLILPIEVGIKGAADLKDRKGS
jgi:hypothetical protein